VKGGASISTTFSGKTCFFSSTKNISVSAKSLFIFQFPATIFFLISIDSIDTVEAVDAIDAIDTVDAIDTIDTIDSVVY
jgi:hypothetical protein